jgi:cytochrome P450
MECGLLTASAILDAGDSKRPKRYFPFAEGPRNCVGQSLAKISLVATMATLYQHFSFKLADEVRRPKPFYFSRLGF